MKKRLPYGISDYRRLKEENFYFIDKTKYIQILENLDSFCIFLRPRRFGKSLLISMLHYYYDIFYKNDFKSLYGDTYIGKNPTKEKNSYHILRFDFSGVSVEDVDESFAYDIKLVVSSFISKYDLPIEKQKNPKDTLKNIFDYFKKNQDKNLFILIDEYDHFANRLLLLDKQNYKGAVSEKTAFFKEFFTVLKSATGAENSPLKRMFITGVTPMVMYDVTSGFNIGKNLSLNPKLNNMTGINEDELNELISYYGMEDISRELLREWYNNYRFSKYSEQKIYNTDMILYYLQHHIDFAKAPDELIDINVRSDYSKLRHIIYTNKKLNGNFQSLQTLIGGDDVSVDTLVQDFSALNLSKEENFKSLMFYLGLVTIGDSKLRLNLAIPNETIKRIDIDFLKDSLEYEDIFTLKTARLSEHLADFALEGDIEVFRYLSNEIKNATGLRDYIYNEQSVKAMLLAYLSLTPYYVIKSEKELNKGFCDIFIKPLSPYVKYFALIEIKYIQKNHKPPKTEIQTLKEEAIKQLERYENDKLVKEHINNGKILKKIVLIYHGWDLLICEEI